MEKSSDAAEGTNRRKQLRCRELCLSLDRPLVMGILNVTPDSFSDGGLFYDPDRAVEQAERMVREGADIIDVGGESSRPGARPVPEDEEMRRIIPVIERLRLEVNVPLSVDTYKPRVAGECLARGVHIVNDITGLVSDEMIELVSRHGAAAVIMHMKGAPRDMQENPVYDDVVGEILDFFRERVARARKGGIGEIIIDPGIGFGKTTSHNLQILNRLREFRALGCPLMVGPSRKSFIGAVTGAAVNERLEGTLAACSIALMRGADILRVHDVKECRRAAMVADAIRRAAPHQP